MCIIWVWNLKRVIKMKKIFTFLFLTLLLPFNAIASSEEIDELNAMAKKIASKKAKLNSTIDLSAFFGEEKDVELSDQTKKYLDNFLDCKADKTEITVSTGEKTVQEILGFDGDKCIVRTVINNKTSLKCSFPKDKLTEVVGFYKDTLTKGIGGKFNFDFDMKMPEINFKDVSDDNLDFGIKLNLPKIKIDKVPSELEKLVKDSCVNE